MRFDLVDRVVEISEDRIVTLKAVSGGEEYLADHFPTFPVLPGVLMLEAMVQAARRFLEHRGQTAKPWVLSRVRALKYGRFVKPGEVLRVEVSLGGLKDGVWDFKGQVSVDGEAAASGRLNLRALSPVVSVAANG